MKQLYTRILLLSILVVPASAFELDYAPLFYVNTISDVGKLSASVYPVIKVSPETGSVLVHRSSKDVWYDDCEFAPGEGGVAIAVLEAIAPDAKWAYWDEAAIPYRRSATTAWFVLSAFKVDIEPFFPGTEIIALVEKRDVIKSGAGLSPVGSAYIVVIDDDYIGEICRSVTYQTESRASGYSNVSLQGLQNKTTTAFTIEETVCNFRVPPYNWRRFTFRDLFTYKDGEITRKRSDLADVEVDYGGVFGGTKQRLFFDKAGKLTTKRIAYVNITMRDETIIVASEPIRGSFPGKSSNISGVVSGVVGGDCQLKKLPDDCDGKQILAIPDGSVVDVLVDFEVSESDGETKWYLIEFSQNEDKAILGWIRAENVKIGR